MRWTGKKRKKHSKRILTGGITTAAAILVFSMILPASGMDQGEMSAGSETVDTKVRISLAGALSDETGLAGEAAQEDVSSGIEQVGEGGQPSAGGQADGSGQPSGTVTTSGADSSSGNGQAPGGDSSSGNGQTSGGDSSLGNGQTSGGDSSSGNGKTPGGESSSGNGQTPGSDSPSGNGQTSGGEPSSGNSPEPGGEPSTESEKPKWPQGYYVVRVTDIAAVIPDGGRIYDGTDRIELTFQTQISQIPKQTGGKDSSDEQNEEDAQEEKVPEYHVAYSAHLESADAGERKVVCSFSLQTSVPEHVTLDEATIHPDLKVTVKKAVLSVNISDGTKRYGDSADLENIQFERDPVIRISGFIRDAEGHEIIPEGFELPRPDVNPSVLGRWSPIYDAQGGDSLGSGSVHAYKNAVTLKRNPDGTVTGNPTANYEFCQNPADERFHAGTVTITRAPVKRDVSYELKGEKDAYKIGEDGTVIVRYGTSLRAEPLSGQGYNTGKKFSGITKDSSFTFRLEQRGQDGSLLADSRQETVVCRVDDSAPQAQIQIMGASSSGGLLFSSSSASAQVAVPEDPISGLSRIRYRVLSGSLSAQTVRSAMQGGTSSLTSSSEWKEISQTGSVPLSGEGIFAVEVEVTDQVGNVSLQRSQPAAIDTTSPGIEITGVEDGSANASAVRIQAQCLDPSYLPGSMKAEMRADFGGIVPASSLSEDSGGGALLSFDDFPRRKEADALYHLTLTASDRAGNQAKKQITFSVNRFGSTYGLAARTSSKLKSFYHTEPFDVTFLETNLDQVGDARVLLRASDSMRELRPGSGVVVSENRTAKGMSQYTYTVPASSFKKDGTYEVMLLTTDRAGNSSDSSAQRLPVRFAIDSVSPEFLVSGIRPEGRYEEKELTAVVEVRDNQALEKAEVYVDARKITEPKTDKSGSTGQIIKIPLSEKEEWQTVQVHASDKAGNEAWTAEIPVYISTKDPMDAENYRKNRLSAQQIELIRKHLKRLKTYLTRSGLLFPKTTPAQAGSVKNLYLAAQMDDTRSASPAAKAALLAKAENPGQEKAMDGHRVLLLMVIALAAAAGIAGTGVFLYRARYSG